MNVIKSERVTMVDVDETLILWNVSEYPVEHQITIECFGYKTKVVPHHANINTLIKFAKLGYTLVVWSGSGYEWAEAVVRALGLDKYIVTIMSKPRYYFDDQPADVWMGSRVYRDPKSGQEMAYAVPKKVEIK